MRDATTKGPTRFRVPMPTSGQWPRAGKIRLGTGEPTGRETSWGSKIVRPQKADHFVVREDESGITTAEAAAAFADAYGDEPRRIRFMLVGDTPDANMEGAWRLYGSNKLHRRCDGTTCSERAATGWRDVPCICAATDDRKCSLTYTIQIVLPDVAMPGVWQLDTGSEISSRRMADWLDMIHSLRGGLRGIEGDLFLVPVKVQPEGRSATSTVYVLSPQARGATVQQLLAGGGAVELGPGARAELPPIAADEEPEPTLDRGGFDDVSRPDPAPGVADTQNRDTSDVRPHADTPGGTPLTVAAQIGALDDVDKARLRARRATWTTPAADPDAPPEIVKPTIRATAAYIEARWPGATVGEILDMLDATDAENAVGDGRLV